MKKTKKIKGEDVVTQKMAIKVRLLCWSETVLNFTDPVARNIYVPNSLSFNSYFRRFS